MSVLLFPCSCSLLASYIPSYEDDVYSKQDGLSSVSEEQPIHRPPPLVRVKRQRGAVDDTESGEGGEDGEGQRQRKRRKTEYTQTTLVNPTQYNPFRDSPLSRAPALEHAPSHDILTPMRRFDLTKSTKRTQVRLLPVMDFTGGRVKRRDSVAERVADESFALRYDEDEDENPEVVVLSNEESLRRSGRHQEEDFGVVTELRTPERKRKSRLNPDLYPAVTYQSEITFFHLHQSSLTLWCQLFELAPGLGLNPEL